MNVLSLLIYGVTIIFNCGSASKVVAPQNEIMVLRSGDLLPADAAAAGWHNDNYHIAFESLGRESPLLIYHRPYMYEIIIWPEATQHAECRVAGAARRASRQRGDNVLINWTAGSASANCFSLCALSGRTAAAALTDKQDSSLFLRWGCIQINHRTSLRALITLCDGGRAHLSHCSSGNQNSINVYMMARSLNISMT